MPITDPAYPGCGRRSRSPNAIDLDGSVGLHPNLAKLAERYQAGQVAIVEGVGYPDPNSLALRVPRVLVVGHARGERQRAGSAATSTAPSGSTIRSPAWASGPYRRPRCSAPLVRNDDHRHHRSPALGAGMGRHARRPLEAWSKFAPASPDPSTLLGQVQQAIDLTVKARADLRTDLASDTAGATGPSDDLGAAQGKGNQRQTRRSPTRSVSPRSSSPRSTRPGSST